MDVIAVCENCFFQVCSSQEVKMRCLSLSRLEPELMMEIVSWRLLASPVSWKRWSVYTNMRAPRTWDTIYQNLCCVLFWSSSQTEVAITSAGQSFLSQQSCSVPVFLWKKWYSHLTVQYTFLLFTLRDMLLTMNAKSTSIDAAYHPVCGYSGFVFCRNEIIWIII